MQYGYAYNEVPSGDGPAGVVRNERAMECEMDGVSDHILCNDLEALLDSGDWAFSLWFKMRSATDGLFSWGNPVTGGDISFRSTGAGELYFAVRNDADTADTSQVHAGGAGTAIDDGALHHAFIWLEQTHVYWYIDGASEIARTAYNKASTTVSRFVFGARHRGASPYQVNLDGALVQMHVYSGVPSSAVAVTAYNGGVPIDERGLGGYQHVWLFGDGDTFDTIRDHGSGTLAPANGTMSGGMTAADLVLR